MCLRDNKAYCDQYQPFPMPKGPSIYGFIFAVIYTAVSLTLADSNHNIILSIDSDKGQILIEAFKAVFSFFSSV